MHGGHPMQVSHTTHHVSPPIPNCAPASTRFTARRRQWHAPCASATAPSQSVHQDNTTLGIAACSPEVATSTPDSTAAWHHDILLVDGANIVGFARSSALTLHGHCQGAAAAGNVACFESWITALQTLTQAHEVYVVFDAPAAKPQPQTPHSLLISGSSDQLQSKPTSSNPTTVDRRQLLPEYKVKRTHKKIAKQQRQQPTPHSDTHDTPPSTASGTAAPAAVTDGGRQQGPGLQSVPTKAASKQRYWAYAKAAERLGCCVLWAPAGREADDLLVTLAQWLGDHPQGHHALLHGGHTAATAHQPTTNLPNSGDTPPRIAVASSDSDMQQLLAVGSHVGWLEVLQLPGQAPDHVAAMRSAAWGGRDGAGTEGMTWLPVRMHHALRPGLPYTQADQGGATSVSANKLAPDQVADYLALVGKKEAGVAGAGISHRMAVNLLKRYQSVAGIAAAVTQGHLDSRLQPTNKTIDTSQQLTGSQSATASTALPPGVQRAVANLALTQLGCDAGQVPVDDIRRYRQSGNKMHFRQHRTQQQQPQTQTQQPQTQRQAQQQQQQQQQQQTKRQRQEQASRTAMHLAALSLPVYHWRMEANQPFLRQILEGRCPDWLWQLLDTHREQACIVSTQHVTVEGVMVDIALVPPDTRSSHSAPLTLESSGSSSGQIAGSAEVAGGDSRGLHAPGVAIVLLGPADFNLEAVQIVLAAGSRLQQPDASDGPAHSGCSSDQDSSPAQLAGAGAAMALSQHVGTRSTPEHLPNKLKLLLRTETLLILRALKKSGWQVKLLPFWEV